MDVNPSIDDPGSIVQALAFSDDGVLYAGFYALFVVDLATGALSYINILPGTLLVAGMEFLPNQTPPLLARRLRRDRRADGSLRRGCDAGR